MNKKLKIVLQTEFACDSVFWIYDEFGENINGGTWVEQEEETSWDSKHLAQIYKGSQWKS